MYKTFVGNMVSTAFKRAALLGLAGAFLTTGFVVVYANITATDLGSGNEEISLSVNTFVDDTEITVENSAIGIVTAAASAAGDSAPGVEPTVSTFPAVNNALVVDNYSYSFDMRESAAGDWLVGEDIRIRVYGYNSTGPASTLLTTLYTDQNTADAGTEGVAVTVDLGLTSSIYDHFDIIVDRQ